VSSRSGEVKKDLQALFHFTTPLDSARDRSLEAGLLLSWNDGKTGQSIPDFVTRITTLGTNFEPAAKRIATFGNDGPLWSEQIVDFRMVGRL
jgi:hypothetical protein